MFRLAILGFFPTMAFGACLANATAPEMRKNLVNPVTGESYPVGVWVSQWAAGYMMSYVTGILIEEMLGFNVTYSEGPGTVEGYYAILGCQTPNDPNDRGCGPNGPNVSYQHVKVESWMGGYEAIWADIAKMENAPVVLTSMGYVGKIAQYFPRSILEAAYADNGLALDYYRGFDADWNEPAKYFDPVSNVNRSDLMKCVDSNFNQPDQMAKYLRISGDTAGLITNAAGEQVGYCPDGYFWIAPKCRADQSKCFPYFTGGKGYWLVETMQKAAKWNIPMALGIGATYSMYTQLPSMHKSLFYWWVPDPTFLHLEAVPTTWPPYDKVAVANFDYTAEQAQVVIAKMVSKDFSALAPRVNSFVDRLTITMDNLNELLFEQKQTGVDWQTMACYWLQNNTHLWSDWLPDDSTCFSKFGMYRESTGEFVDNRDGSTDGISCRPCPSGTYSKQMSDDKGVTYICEPCAPGTSQVSGASLSCLPCERGMYQDVAGQLLCKRCGVGSYQDEEGGPVCKTCPENSRTLQQGSLTIFDCGCEENYIDVAEGAAKAAGNLSCVACQEGLSCPVMGTLESLVSGSHPRGMEHLPAVSEGHFVTAEKPLEVYKCGNIRQCPGGRPAQCSDGLVGVPCAECPQGTTMDGNACEPCQAELQVLWFVGVAAVFLFLTAAYYLMTSKVTAKASVLFTTTCAFGMLISLLQSIGIIGTMTVEFPVDVKGLFSWMSIFLLELDNFGFSCLAGSSTPPRYMVSVLFFPLGIAWLALNWGVPLLNALDCWMSYCIMVLVAASALYLEPINKVGVVAQFVDNFTTGIMVVIFGCIGIMCLMALCGLVHQAAMGGSSELVIFNLGRTPQPDVVAQKLKEMGELLQQMDTKDMEKAFDALAVFDTRRITTFMTMMSAEVLVECAHLSYGARVASSSFSGKPRDTSASLRSSQMSQDPVLKTV